MECCYSNQVNNVVTVHSFFFYFKDIITIFSLKSQTIILCVVSQKEVTKMKGKLLLNRVWTETAGDTFLLT